MDDFETPSPTAENEFLVPRTPRQELEDLIASDKGRLGDVFNRAGLEPEQVAADLNVASSAFVYNMRRIIDAILDGRPVSGPTFRKQVLGAFQTQASRGRGLLSSDAVELLAKNRAAIEAAGAEEDPVDAAKEAADEEQAAATTLAELESVPGIYAFSYGWYLESPVDPERGNTLIKVGMSVNVAQRIREHRTDRQVGTEWFLTNEDFLDAIADSLGLRTVYTGRSKFLDD